MKICRRCKEEKPTSKFGKHRATCGSCRAKQDRERFHSLPEEKKEKVRARRRAYNARPENRKKNREYCRIWCEKNKERVKEYRKKNSKERAKSMKKWRGKNADHVAEYNSNYKKNNRPLMNALAKKRAAIKINAILPDSDEEKMKAFYEDARRRSSKAGRKYVVDHIIPLAKGGAHHQDNLQVISNHKNSVKRHDYDPEKWPEQLNGVWANNDLARKTKKELKIK
tara:strand:+ start:41731 stop:42405 length:675 start_codon:yes stop_codon:yes gene_type:complete